MKRTVLLIALCGVYSMAVHSCKKQNSTPSCPINGTTVNIGGSAGGSYFINLSYSDATLTSDNLYFDNTDLNFYLYETYNGDENTNGSYIIDGGQQSCLNFSYSGTPTAVYVAYKKGEGYVGQFKDGHVIRFITSSYTGGVALISYDFQ